MAPAGSVADVTTRSATAYRLYEQGLRAHFRGDRTVARTFFVAAVAEDSLFALARYYAALDAGGFRTHEFGDSVLIARQRAASMRNIRIIPALTRPCTTPTL